MPQLIILYYWPTPNGKKVAIFLKEVDLPYELVPVDITAVEQFDEEFVKISPNNKMPAIVDPEGPDGQPISVFESGRSSSTSPRRPACSTRARRAKGTSSCNGSCSR